MIEVKGDDSFGLNETDEPSQRTRRGSDGSSLTPRKAFACNGNQPYDRIVFLTAETLDL